MGVEPELKKKRQTLERAKASHLSRQLQMRLQYAKLKVEHGWQRQNLNEVENLYFHHSIRHGVGQRPQYAVTAPVPDSPTPPSAEPRLSPSPDSLLLFEHAESQTPVPVTLGPSTNHPPSAFDPCDPNILSRLAQLQQAQMLSQSSTSMAPSTSALSLLVPVPIPMPTSTPTFAPLVQPPQHPSSTSIFSPTPTPVSISNPHNLSMGTSLPTTCSTQVPTTQAPTIAPTALTYDSFWSTHASSTGPTRALYRTQTGFTASATPAGNVAMLTPGGHAAVMTAEGVYVGGNSRSG